MDSYIPYHRMYESIKNSEEPRFALIKTTGMYTRIFKLWSYKTLPVRSHKLSAFYSDMRFKQKNLLQPINNIVMMKCKLKARTFPNSMVV